VTDPVLDAALSATDPADTYVALRPHEVACAIALIGRLAAGQHDEPETVTEVLAPLLVALAGTEHRYAAITHAATAAGYTHLREQRLRRTPR
jgi:hypothetical protein